MHTETGNNLPGVMIVDDELFFRKLLRDIMTKAGFEVVAEASSGAEALDLYRKHCPAVVVMDIYMPDKNGIETTRELLDFDPHAKIIICSGIGCDDDLNIAVASGAAGVIYKPFYENEIIEIVNNCLNS